MGLVKVGFLSLPRLVTCHTLPSSTYHIYHTLSYHIILHSTLPDPTISNIPYFILIPYSILLYLIEIGLKHFRVETTHLIRPNRPTPKLGQIDPGPKWPGFVNVCKFPVYFSCNTNHRTSSPVNAHLTPRPGIYFNAFLHVYSPRVRAVNPLATNVDVNRKPLSLCPFVAGLKKKMLWSPTLYTFFSCFNIYIYSPGQGQTIHWGQNFDDNRKAFSFCPYVHKFQNDLFEIWFYTHF